MNHIRKFGVVLAVVFVAVSAYVAPIAQAPAPPPVDYNAYYAVGPDSLAHDGVPKGDVRGPFVLPSQAYPGDAAHATGSTCRRNTILLRRRA